MSLSLALAAQDCPNLIGRWPYGPAWAVEVVGDIALFNSGPTLIVADVADQAQPQKIGELALPGGISAIKVAYPLVYAATYEAGLRIITISDPAHPTEIGHCDIPGLAYDIALTSGYAYIAAYDAGLRVIKITDPTKPVEVGYYDSPNYALGIAVAGHFAYLADWAALRVLDISNPASPKQKGFISTTGHCQTVTIGGPFAYLGEYYPGGFSVIDITNPNAPVQRGYRQLNNSVSDIVIRGTNAYASLGDGSGCLGIIDISDPSWPAWPIKFWQYMGVALDVEGDFAFIATEWDGIRIIDISSLSHLTEIGFYDTPGYMTEIAISPTHAFLTDIGYGLQVIDISDPMAPTQIAFLPLPGGNEYKLAFHEGYVYLADGSAGLRIINVSEPSLPVLTATFNTPGQAMSVAIAWPLAYVADYGSGLRVINIANPYGPFEIGFCDTPGLAFDVAVAGSYAYIADYTGGLRIIDISNPFIPFEVGFFDLPGWGTNLDLAVQDDVVFLGGSNGDEPLRIIDVSDPASPVQIATCPLSNSVRDILVQGTLALALVGFHGLQVIDITNPSSPFILGTYDPPRAVLRIGFASIAAKGSLAYLTHDLYGMEVVDLTNCCSEYPLAFNLISPADGADSQPLTLSLDWEDSPLADSYDLYLDTVNPPVALKAAGLSLSELEVNLKLDTTYYWRVIARNECGEMSSVVASFSTVECLTPPDMFRYTYPPDKQTMVPTIVTLRWTAAGQAKSYRMYLGTNPNYLQFKGETQSTLFPVQGLQSGRTYYWKVLADNVCGTREGPIWSFTTKP